jgi:hypothetical protein
MTDIQVTDEHSWFHNMLHEVQELMARGHVFLTKEELAAKTPPVELPPSEPQEVAPAPNSGETTAS